MVVGIVFGARNEFGWVEQVFPFQLGRLPRLGCVKERRYVTRQNSETEYLNLRITPNAFFGISDGICPCSKYWLNGDGTIHRATHLLPRAQKVNTELNRGFKIVPLEFNFQTIDRLS